MFLRKTDKSRFHEKYKKQKINQQIPLSILKRDYLMPKNKAPTAKFVNPYNMFLKL